jgi:hypothetical protein
MDYTFDKSDIAMYNTVMASMERTARDRRLGPSPRTLHLIDIENLIGSTGFKAGTVASVAHNYGCVAEIGSVDLVIVASGHFTALPAWCGWPNVRRLVRSGPDGADLALIKVIETEDIPRRFDRVVIASGDGIFAEPAAWLQAHGCTVTVVTRSEALSRQLHFAARDVRYLDVRVAEAQVVDLQDAA